MTHAEIVATYSDNALAGIIKQLTESGDWKERLKAAKHEMIRRKAQEKQQDQESIS